MAPLDSSVARARWSALLTAAVLMSSSSATSLAFQRSTSHRIRTARWRAGRCWSAATNARRIDSRVSAASAGSSSVATIPSGIGSIQVSSGRVWRLSITGATDGPRSTGRARRARALDMSRHTLVAIRYSHERSAARPSKRSKPRQARRKVSCTASSASNGEPSIR